MDDTDRKLHAAISEILAGQRLAVLATQRSGQPYSSLMAFASTADLATIVAATGRATRKFINLQQQPRVSLLIDTRENSVRDFHQAAAVTVIGRAAPAMAGEYPELERLYLDRHPYLQDFVQAPTTSLIKISVYHFLLVNRFQHVMEYHLRNEDDIFA